MKIHMMAGVPNVANGPIIHVNQTHRNMNAQSVRLAMYTVRQS